MEMSILFWVLMIFAVLFRGWGHRENFRLGVYSGFGGDLILILLLGLLGWRVFGPAVR